MEEAYPFIEATATETAWNQLENPQTKDHGSPHPEVLGKQISE